MSQQQGNYKSLQIKKFPQKAFKDTPENRFWKKFDNVYSETKDSIITSIHSGYNEKNLISFSDGQSVQIYDAYRQKITTQLQRFKSAVTGLNIRKDGNLIAVGEKNGQIQIYDIKRKSALRSYKNHKKAVHAIQFTDQESNIFSGSDDQCIRQFDVAGGVIIRTLPNAHEDFIRSIKALPNTGSTILSSGYDFKINLFDFKAETNTPSMTFDHGHPVEAIAVSPSGFQFTSVGGTYTTCWDIRTGQILEQINNNQKTVTSVAYLSTGDRFITGALDQHVKVYRTDTFSVTHQLKQPHPVVALDFTLDTQSFGVGMTEGTFAVRTNKRKLQDAEKDDLEENKNEEEDEEGYGDIIPNFLKQNYEQGGERINSYKYFNRGVYVTPENYDLKFDEGKKKKLNVYDRFLKKFQYRECLITAFKQNQADIIISLYEEFLQRGCLTHALTDLEDEELKLVFEFIEKKIVNPRFSDMCIDITNILTELYQLEADQVLASLGEILEGEIQVQKDLKFLEGSLETIINTNLLQ